VTGPAKFVQMATGTTGQHNNKEDDEGNIEQQPKHSLH